MAHMEAPTDEAHVSADVIPGAAEHPLVARLTRRREDTLVRVLLGDRTATVAEAGRLLGALRGLSDPADRAVPGLGFVGHLARQADLSVAEMAEAADLDPAVVQAQHDGLAVLRAAELDRLALAVAHRVASALSRTA